MLMSSFSRVSIRAWIYSALDSLSTIPAVRAAQVHAEAEAEMAVAVVVAGEINDMFKKLAVYILFLTGVDFFINLVVNFILHNAGSVIITSAILFAVVFLPYLLASVICIIMSDRIKLF